MKGKKEMPHNSLRQQHLKRHNLLLMETVEEGVVCRFLDLVQMDMYERTSQTTGI